MEEKSNKPVSPSQFYRLLRPEYFSDSVQLTRNQIPREVLAHQLSLITTNLKTEEFESFCRRIAENLIAPNLIPQVGPVGGGDGKTDSETYPVSELISERWFIPENGWDKDEKWAFAISAKETWKSKAKSDVAKIVDTKRGYSRVYFITNQVASSREKKELQDELIANYKIDVIILDGTWILDSLYSNGLIDIAVSSLNLSDLFKTSDTKVGQNDSKRIQRLDELELAIKKTDRYFEYDHQLVEDALEAAMLSRMLERPKDEVEGKFDRAIRLHRKGGNSKQLLRIHYQRAFTYLNWYDDYEQFIEEYKKCKSLISSGAHIVEIELISNLVNLLWGVQTASVVDLSKHDIEVKQENDDLINIFTDVERDRPNTSASLIARTQKALLSVYTASLEDKAEVKVIVSELHSCVEESAKYLDYPFGKYSQIIEELGKSFLSNVDFDNLIDTLARVSEIRSSELAAGTTYLKRGSQKLEAKLYKDAIIYFGRSIRKLAKEESQFSLYICLQGLGFSYQGVGLHWGAYNCFASALSISLKDWFQKGIINERSYVCAKQLAEFDLLNGNLPAFLGWHELLIVLDRQLEIDKNQKIPFERFSDYCLAISILYANEENNDLFQKLPDLLDEQGLHVASLACHYRLGNIDIIKKEIGEGAIKDDKDIEEFFDKIADQPFKDQIRNSLDFMSGDIITLRSTILGCEVMLKMEPNSKLITTGQMIFAFLEGFLATSFEGIYPHKERFEILLSQCDEGDFLSFNASDYQGYVIRVNLNEIGTTNISEQLIGIISQILSLNFFVDEDRLLSIFKDEQVMERLSLTTEHHKFIINTLGADPKLLFNDWLKSHHVLYKVDRKMPLKFQTKSESQKEFIKAETSHTNRKISSIFDNALWDKAHWMGLGFMPMPGSRIAIFLGFEDIQSGRKIFEQWRSRFGKVDKNEEIRLSIIKGISRANPHWYRVHITKEFDFTSLSDGEYIQTVSRQHEMNPGSGLNLSNLIRGFQAKQEYVLIPASLDINTLAVIPYPDLGIVKKKLIIRDAWEIGSIATDFDKIVIRSGDTPVIPAGIVDAPVLKVIEEKRLKN